MSPVQEFTIFGVFAYIENQNLACQAITLHNFILCPLHFDFMNDLDCIVTALMLSWHECSNLNLHSIFICFIDYFDDLFY